MEVFQPHDGTVAIVFQQCLAALLPTFTVRPVEVANIQGSAVGLVGMHRARQHGSVGIAAATATLHYLHPEVGACDRDLSDWIGELANQVLGRFKLGLRESASTLRTSTPVILHNTDVRVRRIATVHVFVASDGERELTAWFDTGRIELDSNQRSSESALEFLLPGHVELFDQDFDHAN